MVDYTIPHSRNGAIQRDLVVLSEDDAPLIVTSQQEVADILRATKAARATDQRNNTFQLLGTMPGIVYEQAIREGWADDPKRIEQWFRDNPAFMAGGKF